MVGTTIAEVEKVITDFQCLEVSDEVIIDVQTANAIMLIYNNLKSPETIKRFEKELSTDIVSAINKVWYIISKIKK